MTTPTAARAPTASPAKVRKPFGWRFISPLLIGSSLNPVNSSMIATGLLGIGLDFHKSPGTTASLISVLYLCSAVMQPTMGKLATVFGARRIFLTGVTILLIAGIIGAAAPAFGFLLLPRTRQWLWSPEPVHPIYCPRPDGPAGPGARPGC